MVSVHLYNRKRTLESKGGFSFFIALDGTALTIGIIGAVNWGLIGFFNFNLVSFLFGSNWFSRILYALVGLCGLYLLTFYGRTDSMKQ